VSKAEYISIEDIVPSNFLNEPRAVMVEAGNGMGKTYAAVQYSVSLQKLGLFDRIYIVQYSQKGCENVVNKVKRLGGWSIWHIGLEKFCPFYNEMSSFIARGLPPSWFCYSCEYFQGKSRAAYMYFVEMLSRKDKEVVKPEVYKRRSNICTHPIVRSYILDPTMDSNVAPFLNETPIIVAPVQLFFNHSIIGRWNNFSEKQKKERKVLLIVDEADTAFFSSLKVRVPYVYLTKEDYSILAQFSPKRKDLTKLLDLYQQYYRIIQEIYKNKNSVSRQHLETIGSITKEAQDLLRSFDRRKRNIVKFVIENNIETEMFRAITSLEELTHIESIDLALKTIEMEDDAYILYDYDYGVKLLFDKAFPWKYFWKINLSATFPTSAILDSRFVSSRGKRAMLNVSKRTKSYENVYVSSISLFDKTGGALNRNKEVEFIVHRLIKTFKTAIDVYKDRFGLEPNGLAIWFGNSKQMRTFVKKLKDAGVKLNVKKRYAEAYYKGVPFFVSYLGSPISRGIDLDKYDISIVISPLLRPPRRIGLLDVLDFAKAVSEVVQGAMRVTRAPKPSRPKLIILESTIISGFYSMFYPKWFKELFVKNYIEMQ